MAIITKKEEGTFLLLFNRDTLNIHIIKIETRKFHGLWNNQNNLEALPREVFSIRAKMASTVSACARYRKHYGEACG